METSGMIGLLVLYVLGLIVYGACIGESDMIKKYETGLLTMFVVLWPIVLLKYALIYLVKFLWWLFTGKAL
jgi:hypothetical protein